MNTADWILLSLLGLSAGIGLVRGLIKEALSLVVWVAALVVAKLFSADVAALLSPHFATPSIRHLIAFAGLFIASLILGALVNFLISSLVKMTGLSGTDRLLGLVFGAGRGFILVMVILLYLPNLVPVEQDDWWRSSKLIPLFLTSEIAVREFLTTVWQLAQSLWAAVDKP